MKHIWFFYLDFQCFIIFGQMPSQSFIKATVQDLDQFPHRLEVTGLVTVAGHAIQDGTNALLENEIRQGFVGCGFLFNESFQACLGFLLDDPLVSLEELKVDADNFRFYLDKVKVKLGQ